MSMSSQELKKLELIGRRLKTSRKKLLALESQGVDIKAPKKIRKFLDKGKEVA